MVRQEDANSLLLKMLNQPQQILRFGQPYLSSFAKLGVRTPPGHPEGYLEAFANIYINFARTLRARLDGKKATEEWLDFPGIDDGIRGMQFIEHVVKSNASTEKWMPFTV